MIHNKTQRAIFKKDGNIYCVYNDCFIINPFNCNVPKNILPTNLPTQANTPFQKVLGHSYRSSLVSVIETLVL